MALNKSTEQLIADLSASIKSDLLADLQPILSKLAEASSQLLVILGGDGRARVARRGRPPGRPAAVQTAPVTPVRTRRRRGSKNVRGQLQETIRQVLESANSPLKLAGIRDRVLADSHYAGRDGKGLYSQIIHAVQRMPEVQRSPKSEYTIKSGRK